jgi:hypothetical protein
MSGLINASGYGNITRDKEMQWVIADLNQTLKWNNVSVKEQRVDGSPVIFLNAVCSVRSKDI